MGVQLMTRYFEEPPEDVFKDVELQMQYRDRWPPSSFDESENRSSMNNDKSNNIFFPRNREISGFNEDSYILGNRSFSIENSKKSDSILSKSGDRSEADSRTGGIYSMNCGNVDSPLPVDSLLDEFKEGSVSSSLQAERSTSSSESDDSDGYDEDREVIYKEEEDDILNEETEELNSSRKRPSTSSEDMPSKKSKFTT